MIKLIVTDMDGTFLDDEKKFSNEFWDIYEKLEQKNIKFVVASGRQYQNLRKNFEKIKDRIIFIAENGSYVVEDEKELYSRVLSEDLIKKYVELGRKIPTTNIVLCGKKSAYIESTDDEFIKEVEKYYEEKKIVSDLLEIDDDEIIKVAYCDLTGTEENVYPHLKKEVDCQIVVSGQIWLDVTHLESNKGIALEILQEKIGITFDETMVFGDYLNDYEMLQKGRYSYAMENAHEKIKEIANFIAKSNNENGVIEELKKIV
ncbi:HAD family hydrolase [Cetobacterium sp. 8H]|uniref:Cof-type HAD-IIB family hydrolase n=1 Tax=Cetobacterium sp. 8H TaxID=2759681 RepID=UPI00163C667E|nr:Cof-type HAD-IIB family hydrolase [Cetobacterium sp. 8H]MBC2851657.1 HAD family hydrolase [Cetobacterium sp. 8H]